MNSKIYRALFTVRLPRRATTARISPFILVFLFIRMRWREKIQIIRARMWWLWARCCLNLVLYSENNDASSSLLLWNRGMKKHYYQVISHFGERIFFLSLSTWVCSVWKWRIRFFWENIFHRHRVCLRVPCGDTSRHLRSFSLSSLVMRSCCCCVFFTPLTHNGFPI